ncbi:MAG TPA: SWIM zinc finger family protein [Polyangiales bacterium]|nr:SWIM zinc finger family protein [Polyangiales bacterium]
MSRWRSGWPPSSPKKPAPEHGIRIKKAGTTWWGKRWIEALELVLRGDSGRLARGKTYARAGRTHDLSVIAGKVTASVTGSRSEPYKVTIKLNCFDEASWKQAIAGMAAKAQFAAELLAGQMPTEIDEVFLAASVSLFPKQRRDLRTDCSCPDWGDPCKHVAATHYVLGEALDRDPFLLFELRGRTKEEVLAALRSARSGDDAAASAASSGGQEIASVTLGRLSAEDYDKPQEPLPTLHFSFDEIPSHGAVLRQLGAPSGWADEAKSPADALAPLVRAAAEAARRIALAELPAAESDEASGESDKTTARSDKTTARSGTSPAEPVASRGGRVRKARKGALQPRASKKLERS